MVTFLQKIKLVILAVGFLLFPLFFLPLAQPFYTVKSSPFYLIAAIVLLLLTIGLVKLTQTKKLILKKSPFDAVFILLTLTIAASFVISSPNKIQALLNPSSGLGVFAVLVLFYFLLIHEEKISLLRLFSLSAPIVGLIIVVGSFSAGPTSSFFFLFTNPRFYLLNSQLDLMVFLGFFVIYFVIKLVRSDALHRLKLKGILSFSSSILCFICTLVAVLLMIFFVSDQLLSPKKTQIPLPPYSVSWLATLEVLKKPQTAFFGAGVDNFETVFTKAKPVEYNQSKLWEVNFHQSRSLFLHLAAETGFLSLFAFCLLMIYAFKTTRPFSLDNPSFIYIVYFGLVFLLLPASFISLFLFTNVLVATGRRFLKQQGGKSDQFVLHFTHLPLRMGIVIFNLLLIATASYFLLKSYRAEYYFAQSLNSLSVNKINQGYEQMRKAVQMNPYIERFRRNFAQLNLDIAHNILAKNLSAQKQTPLSENDRLTATQVIQTAIAESKAALTLNPQKAANWHQLANVYEKIIPVVEGADAWTISAYRQAMLADPVNPLLTFRLGGIFYGLGNYDEASRWFERSAGLKNDWVNAYYNLAWAAFKNKEVQKGIGALEYGLTLVDPKSDDFKKIREDLEEFRKNLPKEEKQAPPPLKPEVISLPASPEAKISPLLTVPQEVSPEAQQ